MHSLAVYEDVKNLLKSAGKLGIAEAKKLAEAVQDQQSAEIAMEASRTALEELIKQSGADYPVKDVCYMTRPGKGEKRTGNKDAAADALVAGLVAMTAEVKAPEVPAPSETD